MFLSFDVSVFNACEYNIHIPLFATTSAANTEKKREKIKIKNKQPTKYFNATGSTNQQSVYKCHLLCYA